MDGGTLTDILDSLRGKYGNVLSDIWDIDSDDNAVMTMPLCSSPGGRQDVTVGTLARMKDGNWLDDVGINAFFDVMMSRIPESAFPMMCMDTMFYLNPERFNLKRRVARYSEFCPSLRKHEGSLQTIFDFSLFIIPINPGNVHWCIVVIDLDGGMMACIDSMGLMYPEVNVIHAWYVSEYEKHKNVIENNTKYAEFRDQFRRIAESRPKYMRDPPLQYNTWDCGVFTCINATIILTEAAASETFGLAEAGPALHSHISQRPMSAWREFIALVLLEYTALHPELLTN